MQLIRQFITRYPALRIYGLTLAVSLIACFAVGLKLGLAAFVTTIILAILEISLSFDNAVVNAKVLKTMSDHWRRIFLTVGILVAVVGVRLLLPVLLVSIFAHIDFGAVISLALSDPAKYGEMLHQIHPEIAAFGGVFLLLLFLDYILGERDILWLRRIELPLIKLGRFKRLDVVITLLALLGAVSLSDEEHAASMLISGIVGAALYITIKSVSDFFENSRSLQNMAKSGLIGFVYLEVLDASFSLDGVLGAFAITSSIVVIMVGLGIGALWVRSMTVHLVQTDTLARFRYLEHGAHYAIGVLAVLLLVSAGHEVSQFITGLVGFGIIMAALADSVRFNRKH
ncbi:MAG TPA: DUF475 domain-containing protein [Candidatus Polarisedimenticolaceae bacterium]|nr:DUF475 domain-containing protein [Candidatus Polarisedimenticolaceae bacterium]